MSDVTLKYPLWQNQYLQAMAETHPELLKSKISAAEQVVNIVGPINLEKLTELEGSFGVPLLNLPSKPKTSK